MGMYTELIFGANFKKDTPQSVIDTLKYMVEGEENPPHTLDFEHWWIFKCSSYYFGVNNSHAIFFFDKISNQWVLDTRSNIKNYSDEIEQFLEWIKPYIDSGSGSRDMYAIVTYEEASEPTIYYLEE